jgi:hypothetical protein
VSPHVVILASQDFNIDGSYANDNEQTPGNGTLN